MFSVIIPTYNRAHLVMRAVNSVLNQTFSDFEIILVDDGSTDPTQGILEQLNDKRIRVVIHDVNKGCLVAKNTGLSKITHEWFTILDSDDEMIPNALECFNTIISKFPDIEVITCNTLYSVTNTYGSFGWSKEGRVSSVDVLKYFYGEHWGVLKSSLIGTNRLNENLVGGDENIFWTKITWNKNRYFINDALRIYHIEGNDRVSLEDYNSIEKNYRRYLILSEEQEYLALLKEHSLKKYNQYLSDVVLAFIKYKDHRRAFCVMKEINLRYLPVRKTFKIILYLLFGTKMASFFYTSKLVQVFRTAR